MIRLQRLSGGYDKDRPIVQDISLQVEKGTFFALLGPNGSGKSTLFKLMTGVLKASAGDIELNGAPLQSYSSVERARLIAVLAQEEQVAFDFTVEEIVMLGRYPHQKGLLKTASRQDIEAVEEAMRTTNVLHYRFRSFRELSGGEKQRVLLAKALAQEPTLLLLDEPTNHLDVRHTYEMLDLLREKQRRDSLTVVAILHDLNVAALYADQVALLREGKIVEQGDVSVLRDGASIGRVYGVRAIAQYHPLIPKPQWFMTPKPDDREPKRAPFRESFRLEQNERLIHIAFDHPLRTISNGVNGEGLQWIRHFCNFHVDKHYSCKDPLADIRHWMEELDIPFEQAVGMMTAVHLKHMAVVEDEAGPYQVMAVVTAGAGNAVDISSDLAPEPFIIPGTINTMVFADAHLTDGALVNAALTVTEAKVKALHDMNVRDPRSQSMATGTSTDSLLIAATQLGEPTPYAGSGTVIGKLLGRAVYRATRMALEKTRR
ncbi:ATP-binding cassette domain-containing protein [Xylanibacillus composti]|uniref:Putative ABC transporter ATP-binding protein YvrA n=1 Tax=Xylanibacillus composti TaxID=1572762 RepID=A0A8J4M1D5_9BACL|nr:adenosylcobinamide amidohydrolase [Xylanibacillus composti]MDT9725638.1 ATP-binding cassette domain-containing protein [Xylanibacillus composti]GIQ67732.1 putative ABC transporter ATP-binding protein YvrA [Xylanibacillus composti]